eukprot:Skav226022  [mRNA]  locus=scaffold2502:27476:28675:- [translate_table: standard]
MNIEGIHPLHFLLYSMERLCAHVVVRHKPRHTGNHDSKEKEVKENESDEDVKEGGASCFKGNAVGNGNDGQEENQDHHESGIISGPLIFSLFPVGCELVHFPWCNAQVEHLCKRVVYIHLCIMQHPPQVL